MSKMMGITIAVLIIAFKTEKKIEIMIITPMRSMK